MVLTRKMETPWGTADYEIPIIDGIVSVGMPSHGGLYLTPELNAHMPVYMRLKGGWYEEDCDWCMPFVAFEAGILAHGPESAVKAIKDGLHIDTLKNWRPAAYEKFYGVTLTGAESFKRAEEEFAVAHAADWVVYSACSASSWQDVPAGMVRCSAGLGMRGYMLPNPTRTFLVAKEEYAERGRFGFVIDLARHQEVA